MQLAVTGGATDRTTRSSDGPAPLIFPLVAEPGPRRRWLSKAMTGGLIVAMLAAALVVAVNQLDSGPAGGKWAIVASGVEAPPDQSADGNLGDFSVFELQPGTCLRELGGGTDVQDVPVVECDEEHEAEVIATVRMLDGPWPGAEAVDQFAVDRCISEIVSAHVDARLSLSWTYFGPSESSWNLRNDRTISCMIVSSDGTLTGSVLNDPVALLNSEQRSRNNGATVKIKRWVAAGAAGVLWLVAVPGIAAADEGECSDAGLVSSTLGECGVLGSLLGTLGLGGSEEEPPPEDPPSDPPSTSDPGDGSGGSGGGSGGSDDGSGGSEDGSGSSDDGSGGSDDGSSDSGGSSGGSGGSSSTPGSGSSGEASGGSSSGPTTLSSGTSTSSGETSNVTGDSAKSGPTGSPESSSSSDSPPAGRGESAGAGEPPTQTMGPVSELPDGSQVIGPLAHVPNAAAAPAAGQATGPVIGVALILIAAGVFIAITGLSMVVRRRSA